MISYDEAIRRIYDACTTLKEEESVPLVLSRGRYLSRTITSPRDVPAADNSAMDGYAVISGDTEAATEKNVVELKVIGESAAGSPFSGSLGPGEACGIMTGGLVPKGADAVAQIEIVEVDGDTIRLREKIAPGRAIRQSGEDMREGDTIFEAGRRLRAEDIGTLATLGITGVPVRVKPKVAILSTGNELVEAHVADVPEGHLRNSSGPALIAALEAEGAETVDLGIVGDDPEELATAIESGLQYDLFLTTGGVSAGAYDHVQHLLPEAGVDIRFHGVAIKPGKPLLFGTYDDGPLRTAVFGLPGNPVSSLVTFDIFVRPVVWGLLGARRENRTIVARLHGNMRKNDRKRHFQRGNYWVDDEGLCHVTPLRQQSSGAMSSLSRGDCLIVVPEETSSPTDGSLMQVIPL